MKDTMWRAFYLEDPIQLQTWLEDLSLKGWKLEKVGYFLGRFQRIPPHRIRYRLEPVERLWEDKPLEYYLEKDRLYAEMGWNLVSKSKWNMCYIYYTEDPDAPELHTDTDIEKELWRRMGRRALRWNLLILAMALTKVLPVLNGLYWSEGDMAAHDLVRIRWEDVLIGAMWTVTLLLAIWRGWKMWRPYRRLQRGDGEPYGTYPTSFWHRWYIWIVFAVGWAFSASVSAGVWGTFGGTDAFPMDYSRYAYGEQLQEENFVYVDPQMLDVQAETGSEMIFYIVRANTFTTVYFNDISQTVSDQNGQRITVGTEYFHMRGPYFTRLLLEKILAAATTAEAAGYPGTDGAWIGTDDDGNPFLLAWRGNQVIRFSCDEQADLTPYAGMVVDLLGRAAY